MTSFYSNGAIACKGWACRASFALFALKVLPCHTVFLNEKPIAVLGKGGRVRTVLIFNDLYTRLEDHFDRSKAANLAPLRAYQVAVRRATLAVGGQATGTHSHRRTSDEELKNAKYKDHLKDGKTTNKASELAIQDTVEHLGHSRNRRDLALAYLLIGH